MSENNKNNVIIKLLKHRALLFLASAVVLLGLIFIIHSLFQISNSEVFVWSRYTSFGPTYFYRDKWYYFYAWPVFALIVVLGHLTLAWQNFKRQNEKVAIIILSLALFILFAAFLVLGQITALPR